LGYNIIDVIDKAITIPQKRKDLYTQISNQLSQHPVVKILSKVLADNVDKTLFYYKKLKAEIKPNEMDMIDFGIYDKISFLINQFNLRIYVTDAATPKDFLSFSTELEKEILALLLDIQGRLVKTSSDTTSTSYTTLSNMIKLKTKLIENLEMHI
jgi:hypothetical protein